MIEMRPVDYTNDTAVIRRFRRMVAINSAIEHRPDRPGERRLDRHALLLRRRRADGLHARRRPGSGGARHHRPALDGSRRQGVADCRQSCRAGAGVVTTRAHVRTVVTEYGVAELFGRTIRERAAALIAIAHPAARDELAAEARRLYHV